MKTKNEAESPTFACLRTSKSQSGIIIGRSGPALTALTQHTVSTIGSTAGYNDDGDDYDEDSDCWTAEDDISIASFNDEGIFEDDYDYPLLNALLNNEEGEINHEPKSFYEEVIDKAIRVASDDDSLASCFLPEQQQQVNHHHHPRHESSSQGYSPYVDYDGDLGDANEAGELQNREAEHFHDSMSSLNEAFEKLNKCMHRTAQSRKLVRELTESLVPQQQAPPSTIATGEGSITTPLALTAGCFPLPTGGHSLKRVDSSSSVCSLGSLGSRSSKGSARGPRSFNKQPRRAFKKGTLSSKTGVAIRTSDGFFP